MSTNANEQPVYIVMEYQRKHLAIVIEASNFSCTYIIYIGGTDIVVQ